MRYINLSINGKDAMKTLTIDQTKELRRLCHAGRLYDIEKMAAQHGTLMAHPEVKRAPIDIALKLGFHIRSGKAVAASDKLYSAVENFAKPMGLVKPADQDKLNASGSQFYKAIRDFAEEKGGHAVPMSVFYNKFTGWQPGDGEKSWGMTRRMVDIFLLALAQQGTIRINIKKGTPIDRSTIAAIEFKPDILRSFESVEVPKAWIDWDVVSPYLEIMTGVPAESYGPKFDQSIAHDAIQKIQDVWVPAEKINGLLGRVSELFKDLQQKDPYDALLLFWLTFFDGALEGEAAPDKYDNFKMHLLKAFDKGAAEDLEKKDLQQFTGYWKSLIALQQHFDDLAVLVRCAGLYARADIPEIKEYKTLRNAIKKLPALVDRTPEFVVDPDRSRAELQPVMEDVWKEYEGPFAHGVSEINGALSDIGQYITQADESPEMAVLTVLADGVPDADKAAGQVRTVLADARAVQIQHSWPRRDTIVSQPSELTDLLSKTYLNPSQSRRSAT